ncbi:hypothetical protein DPMN_019705 [Dreissena polymorpha]|uniref:Uncharacterized protein n=1 Tax=Dreissena polymorpha TaxID=45954 RepID=A0A9D4NJR1_DREPO|nr:hypothetical protein DPMN_019705 [Dreissena polymorpha]
MAMLESAKKLLVGCSWWWGGEGGVVTLKLEVVWIKKQGVMGGGNAMVVVAVISFVAVLAVGSVAGERCVMVVVVGLRRVRFWNISRKTLPDGAEQSYEVISMAHQRGRNFNFCSSRKNATRAAYCCSSSNLLVEQHLNAARAAKFLLEQQYAARAAFIFRISH